MRLAADANVLLSAVLGGRARRILAAPHFKEILTVAPVIAEIEEYAVLLARKKGLAEDQVLLAVAALPVTIVLQEEYAATLPEAIRRIGGRDPDDAELLALAISFGLPIWSNDKDFTDVRVPVYTTGQLLRQFGL